VTTEELRNILLSIVDDYERLITENLALKAVLQSEVPPERDPQRQVQDLIEGMKNRAFRHPKFDTLREQYDDLRQQIQQAAEDHQLVELLMQFPVRGGIN
jgi:hypothetical protein